MEIRDFCLRTLFFRFCFLGTVNTDSVLTVNLIDIRADQLNDLRVFTGVAVTFYLVATIGLFLAVFVL